jgi:NhaP-type Na+/H+ or K+/H+ antiporter
LLILAAAAAGGFVAWHILGLMEQSMLIQIGGSLLVGLVTGAIAWVVLQFLKVTGG